MLFNAHGKEMCTHGTGISAFESTQVLELWSKCLFIGGITCTEILKITYILGLFFVIAYTSKDLRSNVF